MIRLLRPLTVWAVVGDTYISHKETLTAVLWTCFRSSAMAKTILQGTVKGGRRQGRQRKRWEDDHQGMDRSGVRPVPEGSGEQRKMGETGCEVLCGVPTTLAIKG